MKYPKLIHLFYYSIFNKFYSWQCCKPHQILSIELFDEHALIFGSNNNVGEASPHRDLTSPDRDLSVSPIEI